MLRFIDGTHAFVQYEKELKTLIDGLNHMRGNILDQFANLEKLLSDGKENQPDAKKEVKHIDQDINQMQRRLEQGVHAIISCYTPAAEELRLILSIIKLAAQLERMGDHCQNTVKHIWRSDKEMSADIRSEFTKLAKAVGYILHHLESIILHFDETEAVKLLKADDEVDALYKELTILIVQSAGSDITEKTISKELLAAKNLERLADYAIDVIYETYYIHHGKRLNLEAA